MRASMSDKPNPLDVEAEKMRARLRLIVPHDAADPTPESCGIDPNQDWKAALIQRKDKQTGELIYPCRVHNLMLILAHDAQWKGRIKFDEFRQCVTLDGDDLRYPSGLIEIKAWLEKNWIAAEVKTATVVEAIETLAYRHQVHPVRDWLKSLPWDQEDRLDTFFTDFCGTPQTPYAAAVGRSLFISAVARIFRPGCQVDTMVTLEGPQGSGKSSLIRALFSHAWHCEITEAPGALDFYQCMEGKWVGEFSELSAMGRTDQNRVKQALTSTHDTYRSSYGRKAQTRARQFIFIGNTNKDEYLFDETGARRYLPIACPEINVAAIQAVRDQLFAEAVYRFQQGEKWHDIPGAEAEQERRYQSDSWEDLVLPWIQNKPRVTVTEVLEIPLGIKAERHGRSEQTRVGVILRRAKWRLSRETSGVRGRFYLNPEKKQ